MRQGRDLERLIAQLEKVASSDPNLQIESPYMATDRVTGSPREHDVGIIVKRDHHVIVIALECRDRSRNVTVPEVEAFAQKCQDTGIHKGGIVSSAGFAADALAKAKHLSIGCYTIEEVQDIGWLQGTTIDGYSKRIRSNHWLLIPERDPSKKPVNYHVEDPNGNPVTPAQFEAAVRAELKKRDDGFWHVVGVHTFPFRFLMPGFVLCDDETGDRHPLKHANVMVEVEVVVTKTPITKWVYRDEISGTNVIEAGVAPIVGPGINADLLFVSGSHGITAALRVNPEK